MENEAMPNLAVDYFKRGNKYYSEKKYDLAIDDYNEVIRLNPNDYMAHYNIALSYQYGKKDLDSAIFHYSEVLQINPKHIKAYYQRGLIFSNVWANHFNCEKAIADLNEVILLSPEHYEAYVQRGYAYSRVNIEKSILDYTEAIRINPDYVQAYSMRGSAYEGKEEYDNAIMDYSKIISIDSNDALAYVYRASVYNKKGDNDKAISDFVKALMLSPYNYQFWQEYAAIKKLSPEEMAESSLCVKHAEEYSKRDECDRAIDEYTKALFLNPSSAVSYFSKRGLIYHFKKKDYDMAIKDFEVTVRLAPDEDDYREYLDRAIIARERVK